MNVRRKYSVGVLAAACTMILGACSNTPTAPDNKPGTTIVTATITETATETATATAPSPQTSTCQSVVGQWHVRDTKTSVKGGFSEVLAVRAGSHPCFDRLVIETGTIDRTGYQVGYVTQVAREGSGAPVAVRGVAVLQVVINTAGERYAQCRWQYNMPSLSEVACAGSFEGMTKFAVGVQRRAPFVVRHMPDNTRGTMRIVIDIAH